MKREKAKSKTCHANREENDSYDNSDNNTGSDSNDIDILKVTFYPSN